MVFVPLLSFRSIKRSFLWSMWSVLFDPNGMKIWRQTLYTFNTTQLNNKVTKVGKYRVNQTYENTIFVFKHCRSFKKSDLCKFWQIWNYFHLMVSFFPVLFYLHLRTLYIVVTTNCKQSLFLLVLGLEKLLNKVTEKLMLIFWKSQWLRNNSFVLMD